MIFHLALGRVLTGGAPFWAAIFIGAFHNWAGASLTNRFGQLLALSPEMLRMSILRPILASFWP